MQEIHNPEETKKHKNTLQVTDYIYFHISTHMHTVLKSYQLTWPSIPSYTKTHTQNLQSFQQVYNKNATDALRGLIK